MDYYLNLAKEMNADGIDFIELDEGFCSQNPLRYKIVGSHSVEQLSSLISIPKTPYRFWKLVDGKKQYIE